MKSLIKETSLNKMNHQQGMKPYGSIKLTVYGKMVKLTASGTGTVTEATNCGNSSITEQKC